MPVLDIDALIDARVAAIRAVHSDTGVPRAELDLSGGIDSAAMAGLLCLALGSDKLTVVYSSIHSGGETRARAATLSEALGISLIIHDLTATYETMVADMIDNLEAAGFDRGEIEGRIASDPTVLGSIRSCMRAPLGRGYLRFMGHGLRHGTGNECEDRWLRFYQKGGEREVDSNPIAMLSKGEVYQLACGLARRLGAETAYRAIILAAPTPELWGAENAHTDEDEIGSYLGLPNCGETFYSYVDPDTARYTRVGLIERVARFADTAAGEGIFDGGDLDALVARAVEAPAFAEVDPALVARIIAAAQRAERTTRHKMNPNCPSHGTREELLAAGILTDRLPQS